MYPMWVRDGTSGRISGSRAISEISHSVRDDVGDRR